MPRRLLFTRILIAWGAGLVMAVSAVQARAAEPDPGWAALQEGGTARDAPVARIVLLRHAEAPGVGDPPQFRLGDCSTQRNLSAAGRDQARRIGEAFRRHGVAVSAVRTSQWCRTRDTAQLAFPGQARDDAVFNSFFADDAQAAPQTASALASLSGWRGPGVLVVVTHQVNITALTQVYPSSGEAVVVQPRAGGGIEVVARFTP